jgi:hypothetical protein
MIIIIKKLIIQKLILNENLPWHQNFDFRMMRQLLNGGSLIPCEVAVAPFVAFVNVEAQE